MMVLVFVIGHEGSLITRDTISNNISNPPFELRRSESEQSWSSRAHSSFLKPNSPFNPLLLPLSDAIVWSRIEIVSRKKVTKLFLEVKCQFCCSALLPPSKEQGEDRKSQRLRIREKATIRSIFRGCCWPCYTFVFRSIAHLKILPQYHPKILLQY